MATPAPAPPPEPQPPRPARRRGRLRRRLSTVLIAAGLLVLADAAVTVLWREPLTSLQASHKQKALRGDLRRLDARAPSRPERRALHGVTDPHRRMAVLARSLARHTAQGDAIGRLKIPRLDADFVMVKGSDPSDLRKGPGTYDGTPLPGQGGTTAIAGHRTTYLAPFRHLDDLKPGDGITVQMPYGTFTYRVQRTRIVSPRTLSVLRDVGYSRLLLSACHPLFSAAQRIVVVSRLTRVEPVGAARLDKGRKMVESA
jgi:sortase A